MLARNDRLTRSVTARKREFHLQGMAPNAIGAHRKDTPRRQYPLNTGGAPKRKPRRNTPCGGVPRDGGLNKTAQTYLTFL